MTKNDICIKCRKLKSLHSLQFGKYWCNKSSAGKDGLDEFEFIKEPKKSEEEMGK
jgi:hypothetical protein